MKNISNKIARTIFYLSLIGFSLFNPDEENKDLFLTGFGDSPYTKNNPTRILMTYFSIKGYNTAVLDADYDKAPSSLDEIYNKVKPKKIVSLGVSRNPCDLGVLIVAKNLMHASKPDNSGKCYLFKKIDSSFPKKIYLPEKNVQRLISIFEKENINFKIDSIPGTYVCNSLLFRGINLSKEKNVKFYFFHVPYDIFEDKNKLNNLERAIESIARN